ncbi:MAG: Ig-like domain-containing protein, partial [Gemmatimonadaceae bacterium]
ATLQMSAAPLDNNNQVIPGKVVNWFSSNTSAATISASGLITAVSPGSTTITAEADNKTTSLSVSVTLVPVGSIVLTPSRDTLVIGDSHQYIPVVRDTANRVINNLAGRNVSWNSSNVLTATVSGQGVVTAQAPGTATISVTIDGVTSNDLTLVSSQVASITISPNPATVQAGKTLQLTVVLKDAAGNILTSSRPFTTFTSNNTNIATVSSTGIVSGLAIGGPVIITLGINGVNSTIQLSVN